LLQGQYSALGPKHIRVRLNARSEGTAIRSMEGLRAVLAGLATYWPALLAEPLERIALPLVRSGVVGGNGAGRSWASGGHAVQVLGGRDLPHALVVPRQLA
jgi:hypothetical protein